MSMTGFVYRPTVVAKHLFSLEDFFLYYPLKDRSWRGTPNQLDTVSGLFAKAIYAPADDEIIYYSAEDTDGIRNIYRTIHRDTVWTVPALINEHLTSASDEIYPMLSSDGKSLYFASKGLYGVGGYDRSYPPTPYRPLEAKYRDFPSEDNIGYISSEADVRCSFIKAGTVHTVSL